MGYIKPTTPTSAGFAQVFDTSSYAQEAREDRKERQAMLSKTMLEYDPNGLMKNHIPAYQSLMKEYQSFIANNHQKLVNSSENMDVWQQKRSYENEIKNFVAGSMQMNKDYMTSLPIVLNNDRWAGSENEKKLATALQPITVDQFRRGEAFFPIQQTLQRNITTSLDPFIDFARKATKSTTEVAPDKMAEYAAAGLHVGVLREGQVFDLEALEASFEKAYNERSVRGDDLKELYPGGVQEMIADITKQAVLQEGEKIVSLPTGAKKTETEKREEFAFQGMDKSGAFVYKGVPTQQTKVGKRGKTTTEWVSEGKQVSIYGKGTYSLFSKSGTGIVINKQLDEGYNLRTGKYEEIPEAIDRINVVEVSMSYKADKTIAIPTKSGKTITILPGEYLPDRHDPNLNISDSQWEAMKASSTEEETALVYAGTDPMILTENMEREDLIDLMNRKEQTGQWMLMPYMGLHDKVAQAYGVEWGVDYNARRNAFKVGNTKLY